MALVLLALAAAGAWYYFGFPRLPFGVTPIVEIVAAPARFDGREVTVQGVVSGTSDIRLPGGTIQRSYALNDAGAELVVLIQGPLPARGQSLRVSGTVARPPPNQGLAPRLVEKQRERIAPR